MMKKYSDSIGVDTIKRLSREASEETIGIEELIHKYSDDFLNFEYSVVNGVASLMYCEFIRKMRNVEIPVHHIDTPKIHDLRNLCSQNSELMKLLQDNIISAIKNDRTYNVYKDTTGNEWGIIEHDELSDYLEHWIDKIIIPNMGRVASVIDQRFYGHSPNQTFRENREIEMFDKDTPLMSHVTYIANQAVCNYLCEKENVLSVDHELNLNTDNAFEVTDNDIIMVIDEMGVCPVYISLSTILNVPAWNRVSFVTGIQSVEAPGESDTYHIRITHPHSHLYLLKLK